MCQNRNYIKFVTKQLNGTAFRQFLSHAFYITKQKEFPMIKILERSKGNVFGLEASGESSPRT